MLSHDSTVISLCKSLLSYKLTTLEPTHIYRTKEKVLLSREYIANLIFLLCSIYSITLRVRENPSVCSLISSHVWEENKEIEEISRHLTIIIQQIQIMFGIFSVMPGPIVIIKNVADRTVIV